jgi:LacI family transcriptional regulator
VAIDLENAGYEAAGLLNDIIEEKVKMNGQAVYAAATHVVTRQSSDILAIDDAEVSAAVHCIRTKFNSPLMVADVVKAAGSSRRRLQLKFRKILKRSITKEILRVRIEHIARMLLESHMSIDALAASSAFDSTSHMIRVFKQYKGVPPRTFRKMHGAI